MLNKYKLIVLILLAILSFIFGVYSTYANPIQTNIMNLNDERQIKCMADNAYFEAGNQPIKSQMAVSNVIINRTKYNKIFSDTPCGVVYQKHGNHCQFSWVCSNKLPHINQKVYQKAYKIAEYVYRKNTYDVSNGALFFHAIYVHPNWKHMIKTTQLGPMIFYKEQI